MAIAQRGTAYSGSQATSTNWVVAVPSGTAAGDYLLVAFAMDFSNTPTITPATGFTQLAADQYSGNQRLFVFGKVADGSETFPAFTLSAGEFGIRSCCGYSGVNTTTPQDVTISTYNSVTTTTTPEQASQTTVSNGCMIVAWFSTRISGSDYTGTADSSPAATTVFDYSDQPGVGSYCYAEQYLQPSAGAVQLSMTSSQSGAPWVGIQVALRPAGGAPATVSPESLYSAG